MPPAPRIPLKLWDDHKPAILVLSRTMTIQRLMETMREDYNFSAT